VQSTEEFTVYYWGGGIPKRSPARGFEKKSVKTKILTIDEGNLQDAGRGGGAMTITAYVKGKGKSQTKVVPKGNKETEGCSVDTNTEGSKKKKKEFRVHNEKLLRDKIEEKHGLQRVAPEQ